MTIMTNRHNTLRDSDTNDSLTADELGITEEQYADAVTESAACDEPEGHVRVNGRRVYVAWL